MKQILFAAALMLVRMDQSPFVLAPGREKKPAFPLSGRTRGGATGKSNFFLGLRCERSDAPLASTRRCGANELSHMARVTSAGSMNLAGLEPELINQICKQGWAHVRFALKPIRSLRRREMTRYVYRTVAWPARGWA
jgi:hypothetical protein